MAGPARLGSPVVPTALGHPPRSALLAAWGNAWLQADATLPELVARVVQADEGHAVIGLAPDDVPLEQAVTRLRAAGVTALRVVLPAPGDVVGLPGPGGFSTAALAAAEATLCLRPDGTAVGLVPSVTSHGSAFDGTVTTVRWTSFDVAAPLADPGPFLHDAEHDLRIGVVQCAKVLGELDVARWRPELAAALDALRQQTRRGVTEDELPGGYPIRARELLARARQLAVVLHLAGEDQGGAVDSREATARESALRDLARVVRHAHVAAYNAYRLPG